MPRFALASALAVLGLPLLFLAVFADAAGSASGEHAFGWEQKAGVALGCAAVWLACVAVSGWRPHGPALSRRRIHTHPALERARAATSERTWLDISQTRTVRSLGAVQAVVILASALCVLAFTSAPWYAAFLAGVALSIALNLAVTRYSRSALSRERRRRSR